MRNSKKRFLIFGILVVFMICFIIPFRKWDIKQTNVNHVDENLSVADNGLIDETNVRSNNKESNDIIGNLKIANTNIDNDVLQGKDNEYYLIRDSHGVKNIYGSIFMDYRNTLEDRKLLIYGHNSKTLNDVPFHDLEKYIDYTFYKNNKYIYLTLNDEKAIYEIFSVMIIPKNTTRHTKITFNDKEWIEHLNWMREESVYDTNIDVGLMDVILTLQTCYYEPENSYLIINAKKVN